MDAQRALLDQLMGKERNVPLEQRTNRKRHFSDDVRSHHPLIFFFVIDNAKPLVQSHHVCD